MGNIDTSFLTKTFLLFICNEIITSSNIFVDFDNCKYAMILFISIKGLITFRFFD